MQEILFKNIKKLHEILDNYFKVVYIIYRTCTICKLRGGGQHELRQTKRQVGREKENI